MKKTKAITERNRRLRLAFNFTKALPKITVRAVHLLFGRKALRVHRFEVSNRYVISGMPNELVWEVENALFLVLQHSSRIFLSSATLKFIAHEQTKDFRMAVYGIRGKQEHICNVPLHRVNIKEKIGVQVKTPKLKSSQTSSLRPQPSLHLSILAIKPIVSKPPPAATPLTIRLKNM